MSPYEEQQCIIRLKVVLVASLWKAKMQNRPNMAEIAEAFPSTPLGQAYVLFHALDRDSPDTGWKPSSSLQR